MTPWWRRAVFYEIYPRSFADSNGDGIGDLRGIIEHVDYVSRLGIDAIWLGPVCQSPQVDGGYDVSDYRQVDPVYGSLADLDALIAACHDRGIRIVMDMPLNHTSNQHPWFRAAMTDPGSDYRSWYLFQPARPGREAGTVDGEPNDWQSFFGGSAWQFEEHSREYYLHLFAPEQPDLNWANPHVRKQLARELAWWVARGVDGFRLDVIDHIAKPVPIPGPDEDDGRKASMPWMGRPEVHEYLAQLRRDVAALSGRRGDEIVLIGETPSADVEAARRYTDPHRSELDLVFQFEHSEIGRGRERWRAVTSARTDLAVTMARWSAADVWNAWFLGNHDQGRPVSRYGDVHWWYESATALAALAHMQRGTPFVYQGEELGMTNYPFRSLADFHDVEARGVYEAAVGGGADPKAVLDGLATFSRDNARTPMHWSTAPHAGFTTGEPWLPVNPNYEMINAAAQVGRAGSVFEFYRSLIALRHESVAVAEGTVVGAGVQGPIAWLRRTAGEESATVVVNLSSTAAPAPVDAAGDGPPTLTNYVSEPALAMSAEVRPWEARIQLA